MPNKPTSNPPARPIAMTIALQVRITGMRRPQAPSHPPARAVDAMRRAAQASPAVRAAMRRQPAATKTATVHLQKLIDGRGRMKPASAVRHGLAVAGAMSKVTGEMRRDFRKGGGKVRVESDAPLSEKAQHHVEAAERGLRKGGFGLLEAAYHGVQIARESRKAMRAKGPGAQPHASDAHGGARIDRDAGAHAQAQRTLAPMPRHAQGAFDLPSLLTAARQGARIAHALRASADGSGAGSGQSTTLHPRADTATPLFVMHIARRQGGRPQGGQDD